jgi:hypothetical protein
MQNIKYMKIQLVKSGKFWGNRGNFSIMFKIGEIFRLYFFYYFSLNGIIITKTNGKNKKNNNNYNGIRHKIIHKAFYYGDI